MNQLENFNNLNYYSKVLAILVIVFVLLKFVINLNVFEALLLSCIIAVSILIIENIIFINNTSSDPLNCSGCNISTINNDKIKIESNQSTLIVLPENEQKSLIIKPTNNESFTSIDSIDNDYEYKCYRTKKNDNNINNEQFENFENVDQEFDQFINNQTEQNNKLINKLITSENNQTNSANETQSPQVTSQLPVQVTTQSPVQVTTQPTELVTTQESAQLTTQESAQLTTQESAQLTTQESAQVTTQLPVQVTTQLPVQVTTQLPVQVTTQLPVQVTTQSPVQVTTQSPVQVTTQSPVQVTTPQTVQRRLEDIPKQPKGGDTYDVNSVEYQQDGIQDEERNIAMNNKLFRMSLGNRELVNKYLASGGKYYGDIYTRSTNAPTNFESESNELKYGDFNYIAPLNKGMINPEYTFISPSNWYPIPPNPPVCVTNKSCTTCPVMMSDGKDYMQFASLEDFDKSRRFTGDMGINIDYVKNVLNNPNGF
jgi:hypothetical protein